MANEFVARNGVTSLGGITNPHTVCSSTYTILPTDYLIDCSSGTFTVTLPTAVGIEGKLYTIKNSGTGVITLTTTSGQLIDAFPTFPLYQYDAMHVQSSGFKWNVITANAAVLAPLRIPVADADYTIIGRNNYIIAYTSISARRTVTLPPANVPGQVISIVDEAGQVTSTNRIHIVRQGTDIIDSNSYALQIVPFTKVDYLSSGTGVWTRSGFYDRLSTGMVITPSYTDLSTGTIVIGNTGLYNLSKLPDAQGLIRTFEIDGSTLTLVDGVTNYIVADYNSGTPYIHNTTDVTIINESTVIPMYTIFRSGTRLHLLPWQDLGLGLVNKIHQSIVKTQRYRRESGLNIGELPIRRVTLSSGIVWVGANNFNLPAFDSSANTMFFLYHTAPNVWSDPSLNRQYQNLYYDDNTGGLTALNPNDFVVNFIYRGIEVETESYIVAGTTRYVSLTAAQGSLPPASLPPIITSHAVLVGRIIVEKGVDTATQIDNAFDVAFALSPSVDHNSLGNLSWTASGHTDGAYSLAGFDGTGNASTYTIGRGLVLDGPTSMALEASIGSTLKFTSGAIDVSDYVSKTYVDGSINTEIKKWVDINRTGFVNETEINLTFNPSTYVLNLVKTGTNWTYFRGGKEFTFTKDASIQIANPPINNTTYYITINNNLGNLEVSTIPWTMRDQTVSVATILWDASAINSSTYQFAEEMHQSLMDTATRAYLHFTRGTQYLSGGALTGPTVGGLTNQSTTFGISATNIADEDMFETLPALARPDGSTLAYTCFYRTTPSTWAWKDSSVPYTYGAANLIQWDNAGVLTEAANLSARFYNWYLLYTNFYGRARYTMIPGRGIYTSLALAQAENVKSFDFTGLPIQETVIAYQMTWETRTGNTNLGKVRLAAIPVPIGTSVTSTIVPSPAGTHNLLAGLQGGSVALSEFYHIDASQYDDFAGRTTYVDPSLVARDSAINLRLREASIGTGFAWTSGLLNVNNELANPSTGLGNSSGAGMIVNFVAGTTISPSQMICISSNGRAYPARADSSVSGMPAIAINHTGAIYSAGTEYPFLMSGTFRNTSENLSIGEICYVNRTGFLTTTQPDTPGYAVQPVGVSTSPNSIVFNPTPLYIIIK